MTWVALGIPAGLIIGHVAYRINAMRQERAAKAAKKRNDHYVNLDGVYGHLRSLRR